MHVLLTGGAGYVGSVTAAVLLEAGHTVTVFDDLSTGHRDALAPEVRFHRLDLHDAGALHAAVAAGEQVDAVVHCAAKALVAESMAEPADYFRHNVATTANVLEAMRAFGIGTIVASSTAAVYGDSDEQPITEDAPTAPTNAYGGSKLAVDSMLGFAAPAYGIAAVSLRYFNVVGAYGDLGERHALETHLIPLLMDVAAGRSAEAAVHGADFPTPDGTAVRDYIHVRDLAAAHLLALRAARPGRHLVCNLGTGTGFSVLEVLAAVRAVTGEAVPAALGPRRPGDPPRLVASADRAREVLGWKPEHGDLAAAVADAWRLHRCS
jgi:UDP-glucose 4-epimerase